MARLTPPVLISEKPAFEAMLRRLASEPRLAVDTESNSLYAYQERVCLLQVSVPGVDYLVDPLASPELGELRSVFADPSIEKVLHACEYDVICLRRDFGFQLPNLFDTMWAARILGWPRVGLADILKERFDVTLDKRWQRYNWGKRPLPADALAYAQLDTHYLLRLRDIQMKELEKLDRVEEAQEVFADLARSEAAPRDEASAGDGFWRVKGAYDLDPASRAVLRELYLYRESEARRLDRPPFKIIGDRTLVALAASRPARLDHLRRVPGMTEVQIERHGRHVLRAVARGNQVQPPRPSPRTGLDPAVADRYERLRAWRKGVAARRGVDADVVVSNAALMALARRNPRDASALEGIDGLGPWRRRTYGEPILEALRA